MTEVIKWIKEEYNKVVKVDTHSAPINRIYGFIDLKYKLSMAPTGYVYMPFTMSIEEGVSVIFATVYWKNNTPIFTCASPSYESSKGEFRDSFCNYSQFSKVFKDYSNVLDAYTDIIHKKVDAGSLNLDYGIYSGTDKFANAINNDSVKDALNVYDLQTMGIKLLALSAFTMNYRTYYNQTELNTHRTYVNMVHKVIGENPELIFKDFKTSKKIYNNIFRNGGDRPYGQKVIPLTVGEVISLGNISYKPWREIVISYAVSDMVLNYVGPGFALGTNWTMIEGMDATMFDNVIIKDRIEENVKIQQLIKEYKRLYDLATNIPDVEGYSEGLLGQINDLNKNKLISRIAIGKVDENVGFTFTNIPRIIRKASIVPPHYEKLVTDLDMFNKYMFDLLYSCHVLHKRLGIIHFDLHLNNATIMKAYSFYKTDIDKNKVTSIKYNKEKRYNVSYSIDEVHYVFPFDGFYGTIIDFSDSIINKTFLEYTDRFIARQDMDFIIDRERDEISSKIFEFLKYSGKDKDILRGSIISDYDDMFIAISTIDYITVLRKLRMTFENEMGFPKKDTDAREFKVSEVIMKKLKMMENRSLEYFLENVNRVMNRQSGDRRPDWPGDVLLNEFFKNYITDSADLKKMNIYEAWNFNAEHKYSVSEYNSYPPWIKKGDIVEKFDKKIAEEFVREDYISNELKTSDTHLDFILETIGLESEGNYRKMINRSRGRAKAFINVDN